MSKSFDCGTLIPVYFESTKYRCPSPLNFFKVYFNIAYYLGIAPFRFRYQDGSYKIYETKKQNVICFICQSLCIYQFANLFRGIELKKLHINPNNFFEFANVIGFSAYLLVLYGTFWTKKSRFSKILELVQNSTYSYSGNHLSSTYYSILLCIIFIGWSLYNVFAIDVAINKWEFLQIPHNFTSRAMFVYLYESNWTLGKSCYNNKLLAGLGSLYALVEFYQWLSTHFTDLFLLLAALFLREIATEFSVALKKNNEKVQGLEYYKWIKSIIKEINAALGILTLCVVVTALPYYASNVETVLGAADFVRKFRITFFCAVFFISLGIAADANQKINEIKEWIMDDKNVTDIPQSTLIVIINEVSQIGLKGSNFFTVTFGFLATVTSIVLTYSIIIVQIKIQPILPSKSS